MSRTSPCRAAVGSAGAEVKVGLGRGVELGLGESVAVGGSAVAVGTVVAVGISVGGIWVAVQAESIMHISTRANRDDRIFLPTRDLLADET